jgi:V/A-type H+-transporting ATPase subunit I
VLDLIGRQALDLTGGRAELVTTDVDASTRAMLIVFPSRFAAEIEALLGREDISRLRLPTGFDKGPPDVVIAALHRRLTAIPGEIEGIERELAELAARWSEQLAAWRDTLRDELQSYHVLSRMGETDMTFVLVGWCPAKDVERVERALRDGVGETVLLHKLPLTREMKERAPVVLRNPLPARPFESLVGLLALPRYGGVDPTRLMAFFLPIFFGMMLGDVGYGLLLLAISLGLLHKFKTGIARDVLIVLAMGAGWTIVFGVLFGEAFGTLGEHLGMRALWFERASPQHVAGLLLMTLAVGAVHMLLGLALGVWEAIRERSQGHLLERGGMLVGLVALFGIVGVLVDFLPEGFMTPAIAALIVGIVLVGASLGWLGLLMGPIEFLGLIGNVLSYLRIAAIGLASIYLARVANDMAGMLGSLIVGVIVAVLLHALNLVMGAFSPTIHSLRLHYVEFFRKFYEGGGRPYEPFKSQLDFEH